MAPSSWWECNTYQSSALGRNSFGISSALTTPTGIDMIRTTFGLASPGLFSGIVAALSSFQLHMIAPRVVRLTIDSVSMSMT